MSSNKVKNFPEILMRKIGVLMFIFTTVSRVEILIIPVPKIKISLRNKNLYLCNHR